MVDGDLGAHGPLVTAVREEKQDQDYAIIQLPVKEAHNVLDYHQPQLLVRSLFIYLLFIEIQMEGPVNGEGSSSMTAIKGNTSKIQQADLY